MRLLRKVLSGKIDSHGELVVRRDSYEEFCRLHPGRSLLIHLEVIPKEPSERTRNFFFGYIIPEVQGILMTEYGERYTKEQTYDWIRRQCPMFIKEERVNGKWKAVLKEFEELDSAEAGEVIDWAGQYCAEHWGIILDDPKR